MSRRNQTTEAILAALVEAAETGAPCPSNTALGAKANIRECSVTEHLKRLEDDGAIKVERAGKRSRVVEITATGKRTGKTEFRSTANVWGATETDDFWRKARTADRLFSDALAAVGGRFDGYAPTTSKGETQ